MKLQVIDGDRKRKPHKSSKVPRFNLRWNFASLRTLIFVFAFTAATIVFDANPVLVGETAASIIPIVCIFAAWFMTCATARSALIVGAGVLLAYSGSLLFLSESAYLPVTPVMLQGHVVAATIGLILGALASDRKVGLANATHMEPQQRRVGH